MKQKLSLLFLSVGAIGAHAQTVEYELKENVSGANVPGVARQRTYDACDKAAAALKTGREYHCRRITKTTGAPVPPPPPPSPTPPAPPPPAPTPPPAPPPPAPVGALLHFSPTNCSNANPGTVERPKCDLAGVSINTLPTPIALRFAGGNTWDIRQTIRLQNTRSSAAAPVVFESYGTGEAKLRFSGGLGQAFEWGEWGDGPTWSTLAGYTFRNIALEGDGTVVWGLWLRGGTAAVLLDNVTISGFHIGINCQPGQAVRGLTVRNSRIVRNNSMGVLGSCSEATFENNLIAENNFGGSNRDHGMYLSGVRNTVIRGNQFVNNSVVNGVCTGGNLTLHGQNDGLVIENNRIVIPPSPAFSCWPMALTASYTTAEWFRNTVVRNNTITNYAQNYAIVYSAAPGIVIENNTLCKPGTEGNGISRHETGPGDDADGGEVIRGNVRLQVCP